MNRLSVMGALLATLASSACCIAPAMLAAIGISGVGVGAFLMAYRPLFLAIGGAFLLTAFASAFYRARVAAKAAQMGVPADAACCAPGAVTAGAGAGGKSANVSGPSWFLWAVALTAVMLAAYPYFASAFRAPIPVAAAAIQPDQPQQQPAQPQEGSSCGAESEATPCGCH